MTDVGLQHAVGQNRQLIIEETVQVGEQRGAQLIATPTTPTVAFAKGAVSDPYEMYLNDVYTIPANIAGLPAISQPAGFGQGGMPVGLQLMANSWDEATLFRGAYAYQQATDWHTQRPSL